MVCDDADWNESTDHALAMCNCTFKHAHAWAMNSFQSTSSQATSIMSPKPTRPSQFSACNVENHKQAGYKAMCRALLELSDNLELQYFTLCRFADIDYCSSGNGGCQHKCVSFGSSYRCECNNGYRLQRDGVSCEGTQK